MIMSTKNKTTDFGNHPTTTSDKIVILVPKSPCLKTNGYEPMSIYMLATGIEYYGEPGRQGFQFYLPTRPNIREFDNMMNFSW